MAAKKDDKADKKNAKPEVSPDDIMASAEMKPILAKAKRGDPVSCAIGMTKDKDGVILLDKKRKPKKLMAEMKKQAASLGLDLEATSLRFGRASVDTDEDASLVTFTVNKETSGAMRMPLLERIKKAGFTKIEIIVDAALENDSEEEEAPAPAMAGTSAGTPAAAGGGQTPPGTASSPVPPPPMAPASSTPAAAGQAPPDAAAVAARLTGLVKQMIAAITANPAPADPGWAAKLKASAVAAQASLKAGDIPAAEVQTDALGELLDKAPPAGTAPASSGKPTSMGSPVFKKARDTWLAARKKVVSEVDKLHTEMTSVYADHAFSADLDKFFHAKVEPMLDQLDDVLAEKLDEVAANGDPAEHMKLVQQARQIISRYESYLASEPLIGKLDANPFVPLAIQKTLTATLEALSKAVV